MCNSGKAHGKMANLMNNSNEVKSSTIIPLSADSAPTGLVSIKRKVLLPALEPISYHQNSPYPRRKIKSIQLEG